MDFWKIDVFDKMLVHCTSSYNKNNENKNVTELEFFKFVFRESIAEIDVLRQASV